MLSDRGSPLETGYGLQFEWVNVQLVLWILKLCWFNDTGKPVFIAACEEAGWIAVEARGNSFERAEAKVFLTMQLCNLHTRRLVAGWLMVSAAST